MNNHRIGEKIELLQNRKPKIYRESEVQKAAVLIPLLKKGETYEVLFEVRAAHLHRQPNDVCFPGGKIDQSDQTPMDCALREMKEEVGIGEHHVKNILPLDKIVSDVGGILYPYAGVIEHPFEYDLNKDEVQEIFTVPLQFFLEHQPDKYHVHLEVNPEKNFPYELIQNGREYGWRTRSIEELFYLYDNRVIWGLTAKILTHFIELIK